MNALNDGPGHARVLQAEQRQQQHVDHDRRGGRQVRPGVDRLRQPPAAGEQQHHGHGHPGEGVSGERQQDWEEPTAVRQHVPCLARRDQIHANQGRYRERMVPCSIRFSNLAFHRSP